MRNKKVLAMFGLIALTFAFFGLITGNEIVKSANAQYIGGCYDCIGGECTIVDGSGRPFCSMSSGQCKLDWHHTCRPAS